MPSAWSFAGQAVVLAAAAAFVGAFAAHPVYRQVPEGDAQIKLALQHAGARVEDCRRLSAEELAKLPTAERRPNTCSRERVPLVIELDVDGRPIYEDVLPPTGLSRDGASRTYQKFLVPAGPHMIEARLRDSKRLSGFDYEKRVEAELKPWQNLAIDFNAEKGGFLFR
ncbi:MAG TPA: hypothetical protein VEH77_09160 [Roseiarcus sp.]|nr:hypothetical protein [Roseiarcus sp.]